MERLGRLERLSKKLGLLLGGLVRWTRVLLLLLLKKLLLKKLLLKLVRSAGDAGALWSRRRKEAR